MTCGYRSLFAAARGDKQDDEGRKMENTLAHLWKTHGEETATGWPGVCCTDFELVTFQWGLETVFADIFWPRCRFWSPEKRSERCTREREGGAFVSMKVSKNLCCCGSLLTHLILLSVDLSCLGLQFNSWLVWFIACLHGLKVQRVWWLSWVWLPPWYSANMFIFFFQSTEEKLCVLTERESERWHNELSNLLSNLFSKQHYFIWLQLVE